MEVINYLREKGLQSLVDTYAIRATRHRKHPHLVQLSYNQIESPMGVRAVQECRGLILDESANWAVVAWPYTKFFNHDEGHAAKIDWKTAKAYEKADGSLMILYWYGKQWNVATSGTPDASGIAHNSGVTFSELFWRTWKHLGYELPTIRTVTYMFELMTPENRVVVPHVTPRIVLHGARDLHNHREMSPEFFQHSNWEKVRTYDLRTISDIVAAAAILNPMESEGFVVVDADFHRVKVKSPQYVAIHHLKDGLSERRMLELVRTNEGSEFLAYFPELKPLFDEIKAKYDALVADIEMNYERLKDIVVQKDFALQATKTRFPGALFALRSGGVASAKDYLATVTMQNLERHI